MSVIDIATYIHHSVAFPEETAASVETLIKYLDASNTQQALLADGCFMVGELGGDYRKSNDHVAEAVERYPERLLGSGLLQPTTLGIDRMIREAERCVNELGFHALRVYPSANYMPANDLQYMRPLLGEVARLGVPLWIHSNEGPYTTHILVADLARQFPQIKFVLANWGYGSTRAVPYIVSKYDNLYLDMSSLDEWEVYYYPDTLDMEEIGIYKFLYGSNFPLDQGAGIQAILRDSSLSSEQFSAVLGGNAQSLLGL